MGRSGDTSNIKWLLSFIITQAVVYTAARTNGPNFNTLGGSDISMLDRTGADGCYLTVANSSATGFKTILEQHHPNFVHFHFWFNNLSRVPATKEAILPYRWVWTYDSPDGFFPYLMWPVDFPVLSFGLLDVKTQPQNDTIWLQINSAGNCSLTLGEPNTTKLLAYALRDMTFRFLLQLDQTAYSFTYYCYLEEVPGVKQTVAYQLALYIGFPVEFDAYRCCRTRVPKYTHSKMYMECLPNQDRKMVQTTIIPYILGLIAFVYFPTVLLGFSEKLVSTGFYQRINEQTSIDDTNDLDWVFLTGKSPLTFSGMLSGMCGLASNHPTAVSRIRRFLFVLLSPCVIGIELYVYNKCQHDITMALLAHDRPMGYLSMLGGYDVSKKLFMPLFGGPFVLLPCFYIAGCIFIILPNDLNTMVQYGSSFSSTRRSFSPLFFSEEIIEKYSGLQFINKFGYAKAVSLIKSGLCMLVNPQFWSATIRIQFRRFNATHVWFSQAIGSSVVAVLPSIVIGVLLVPLCLVELCLCFVYYGMPVVSFIIIASKGYIIILMGIFIAEDSRDTLHRPGVWSHVIKIKLLQYVITIIVSCVFIYFLFSFCTIFVASFAFVAKLLVFSLLAVIVYPSYAFGYLFFGAVILYYVYKVLKMFGEGYADLLSEAVEISQHLEEDYTLQSHVFNGTIILSRVDGVDITQLQIYDTVVNLSTDQRQQIRSAAPSSLSKTRERNNVTGIPRDLFDILVRKYKPVHIQVAKSLLWLGFVIALMGITISIIVTQPQTPAEGMYEVMHVLFIMIVGALPGMLRVILDRTDHATTKDIQMKRIKGTIVEYWVNVNIQYSVNHTVD